jgi:hypothetical protein
VHLFGSLAAYIDKVFLFYSQVLNEVFKFFINELLELPMDIGVLQFVFILVFKTDTVSINEVNNRCLPNRGL